jgi:hypothetical protein
MNHADLLALHKVTAEQYEAAVPIAVTLQKEGELM